MKKYQKGFTPIIALVLVAAVGFVLSFVYKNFAVKNLNLMVPYTSPTAESIDTKEWKTYTNKNIDFSFKYDPKFTIKSNPLSEGGWPHVLIQDSDRTAITIFYHQDTSTPMVEADLRVEQQSDPNWSMSKTDELVDGEKAVRLISESKNIGGNVSVYVSHNGKLFQFFTSFDKDNKNEIVGILNTTISTFKFTN